MKYFNLKNLSQVDYIFSDWIRKKRWLRSGPTYNYQLFDYIKEMLKFDKKKLYRSTIIWRMRLVYIIQVTSIIHQF